jgi:hypothetical protein
MPTKINKKKKWRIKMEMNPELTAEIKPTPKINRKESRKGIPKRK